jgi:hypothetical protein
MIEAPCSVVVYRKDGGEDGNFQGKDPDGNIEAYARFGSLREAMAAFAKGESIYIIVENKGGELPTFGKARIALTPSVQTVVESLMREGWTETLAISTSPTVYCLDNRNDGIGFDAQGGDGFGGAVTAHFVGRNAAFYLEDVVSGVKVLPPYVAINEGRTGWVTESAEDWGWASQSILPPYEELDPKPYDAEERRFAGIVGIDVSTPRQPRVLCEAKYVAAHIA